MVEKILIEPESRFRLEHLCDSLWPQEVGGYVLGEEMDQDIVVKDVFPVPNVSEGNRRNKYKAHPWGERWSQIYAGMAKLGWLDGFRFHSHPNATIPSQADMSACSGLNLWIVHHDMGKHTFTASRDFHHREVLLLNEPREMVRPHFEGDNFNLGTVSVDSIGRLRMNPQSLPLIGLKEETRRILLLALRSARRGRVDLEAVIKGSNRSKTTVRKHLNLCLKPGLLKHSWNGRDYEVPEGM